jgi:hypothetical protein
MDWIVSDEPFSDCFSNRDFKRSTRLSSQTLSLFALFTIGMESEKWADVIANKWIRQQHDVSTFMFMVTSELRGVGILTSLGRA